MLVEITKEEYKVVMDLRRQVFEREQLTILRKNCIHDFSIYGGHGHNYDWYECRHCGETEER